MVVPFSKFHSNTLCYLSYRESSFLLISLSLSFLGCIIYFTVFLVRCYFDRISGQSKSVPILNPNFGTVKISMFKMTLFFLFLETSKVCSFWSCAFLALYSSEHTCARKVLSLSYHAIVIFEHFFKGSFSCKCISRNHGDY